MPGNKYRLTYFPIKGRGELIRLIFHGARVPFEDRRVAFADWPNFKSKTRAGTLPMLEINGEKFVESRAMVNWAARKFGLMGKTDAEELRTDAILIQSIAFGEKFIVPLIMEKDPEKIEGLKQELETAVEKVFTAWDASVIQTESNGRKVFSYMITQSLTAADLAVLNMADLTEDFITVDWARFPRLQAVIRTVSEVPHLKAYLINRDNPPNLSKTLTTPRHQPETARSEATAKKQASSKSMESPRAKATPRQLSMKQKA